MSNWNVFDELPEHDESLGDPIKHIMYVDEGQQLAEEGKLLPLDTPVHLMGQVDHRPVCWPVNKNGAFAASYEVTAVTCKACEKLVESNITVPEELKP